MACVGHTATTSCSHTATTDCAGHAATTSCAAHGATTTCEAHTNDSSCTHTNEIPCGGHVAEVSCTIHQNVCPAHSGASVPSGMTNWTDPVLDKTIKVKVDHHNELREAINGEIQRRGVAWPVDTGEVTNVNKITSAKIRELRDGIDTAWVGWEIPTALADENTEIGDKVQFTQFNELRTFVNLLENECTCQCNYSCTCQCNYDCTCNCNYSCTCQCNYSCTCDCNYVGCTCDCNYACTCDCNYACTCDCNYACTCNCNYCTCQCNYACTCNCNYSDERLKTDIEYM